MEKELRMEAARGWLRLVRGEGDEESKREYLQGRGLSEGEVRRVLEDDEKEARGLESPPDRV